MPLNEEVVRSLFAAWRIARFDPNAMSYFNLSLDGFWRSFVAALLVLPFYLLLSGLEFIHASELARADALPSELALRDDSLLGFIVLEVVAFACAWAAWPLLMVPISRFLGLDSHYVPYIIAANWGAVLQNTLLFAAQFLVFSGLFPDQLAGILLVICYITVLYYGFLVVRAGLQCDVIMAIGLVVLKTLVVIGISIGFRQLA